MNKQEVILTVRRVGKQFGRVMASLHTPEFVAGYYQCANDMVRLFNCAPIAADFDAERAEMRKRMQALAEEVETLKQALNERDATIDKLMKHVNLAEVLGIATRQKKQDVRR